MGEEKEAGYLDDFRRVERPEEEIGIVEVN